MNNPYDVSILFIDRVQYGFIHCADFAVRKMKYMRLWLFSTFLLTQIVLFSQDQTVGLFVNEEEALNGYTLFTNNETTYLIDNCGLVINRWQSNFKPGLGVYLLENGNLLRSGRISGSFNGGGAGGQFELLSWNGNFLWNYEFSDENMQAHHDIEPLPNGNFLAMAWTFLSADEAFAAGREYNADIWIEKIFEIKIVGTNDIEIVWEWSMADHLVQNQFADKSNFGIISENPGRMDFNYLSPDEGLGKDWAHFNAIDYNESLDQIVVSSKIFSEIWIIDHSTTTEEARTSFGGNSGKGGDILYRYGNPQVYDRGGPEDQVLFQQHNIEWVSEDAPNGGSLSVFNNLWMSDRSRAERWTPPVNDAIYKLEDGQAYGPAIPDWTYDSPDFFSSRLSSVQFLSNENALICSGGSGKFFEITKEGDIVWEYVNPVQSSFGPVVQGEAIFQNSVFKALKYQPSYAGFDGRELVTGDPIELEPFDSDCLITTTETENIVANEFRIIQTMVSETLEFSSNKRSEVQIVNLNGIQMDEQLMETGLNQICVSNYSSGMYFLVTEDEVFKFMKY